MPYLSPFRAIGIIVICGLLFPIIGGTIGYSLGRFMPNYYRFVFIRGDAPDFDAVAVGVA